MPPLPKQVLLHAALVVLTLTACSGGGGTESEPPPIVYPDPPPTVFGGDRPVTIYVPPQYTSATPMPLVVVLHGFAASGALQEFYFQLQPQANAFGFLYIHPNGLLNSQNERYWNATDACCDFEASNVDDSAYLIGLVHEIEAAYNVDRDRIYFVGHSNGGFMALRMACEHADEIAAVVSLAGAMPLDAALCDPSEPVSVLQIHGTADATIAYAGGMTDAASFPSARTTIEDWAALDGCATTPDDSAPPLDLDSTLAGAESTVSIYADGCAAGGRAELWTIVGGAHIPMLSPEFSPRMIEFLFAHPQP
jgi:polyhydroxybutyrate depolymerase